nr:hypothetical protein [uncultured Campylobacter sp.]
MNDPLRRHIRLHYGHGRACRASHKFVTQRKISVRFTKLGLNLNLKTCVVAVS